MTDMKPGDPAVRLYACEDDPKAPWCNQPIGKKCITKTGNATSPHPKRWALGRGYADATNELQPKIDRLTAQNTDLARKASEAADDLVTVRQQNTALERAKSEAEAQLKVALERIDELEQPPAPPPVTVQPLLIGAGGGNVDRSGDDSIDIDRPYYDLTDSDIAKLVARAKKNHAEGILTWATFKLPVSWVDAAAGKADDLFDRLVAACRALGFEIWIDFHHEPEGDGDPTVWAAFNLRFAKRLGDGKTGPVKYVLCVTGYSEEYGAAGSDGTWDKLWPEGAAEYVYAIAYDNPYLRYGLPWKSGAKVAGGKLDTTWSEGKASYVDKLIARAKKLGVKALIGECGYGDEAFAKDPGWLDRFFLAGAADEVLVGIVYFDSVLNSTRSWLLGAAGSAKRLRFQSAAAAARAARAALR